MLQLHISKIMSLDCIVPKYEVLQRWSCLFWFHSCLAKCGTWFSSEHWSAGLYFKFPDTFLILQLVWLLSWAVIPASGSWQSSEYKINSVHQSGANLVLPAPRLFINNCAEERQCCCCVFPSTAKKTESRLPLNLHFWSKRGHVYWSSCWHLSGLLLSCVTVNGEQPQVFKWVTQFSWWSHGLHAPITVLLLNFCLFIL